MNFTGEYQWLLNLCMLLVKTEWLELRHLFMVLFVMQSF